MSNTKSLWALFLALGCSTLLSACLPEDKDPNALAQNAAGKQEAGAFYGAAMGNIALQLQNAVISDPNWFTSMTGSQELNLAAMNIKSEGIPAPIKSHMCQTGVGTQWMQVTWIDGRDDNNNFSLKGIGDNGAALMSSLRARMSADQLGSALGSNRVAMTNKTTTTIPTDCGSLNIPVGAPVIAFLIDTPATPTTTLSRTEYRSVDCNPAGTAEADKTMTGTKVQKRVVNYNSSGAMTVTVGGATVPYTATAGWQDDAMGECINAVRVAATTSDSTSNTGASIDTFANMAVALKDILNAQIRTMNCRKSTIDNKVGSGQTRQMEIDTCAGGLNVTGRGNINEQGDGQDNDEKVLKCDAVFTPSIDRPFGGIDNVKYTTDLRWTGNAYLVRDRNAKAIGANGDQVQITRWIGKNPNGVFCDATDRFYANCQQITGAPDLIPYEAARFKTQNVAVDRTPMSVSSSHYVLRNDSCPGDICMGGNPGYMGDLMASVSGGDFVFFRGDEVFSWGDVYDCGGGYDFIGADCLHSTWTRVTATNKNHFEDTTATITDGVRGEKKMEARAWADRVLFKPRTTMIGTWNMTSVGCEWTKREAVADCPALMDSDSRQGNWNPTVMDREDPFPDALSGPGINYSVRKASESHSGAPYNGGVFDRQVGILAHIRNTVVNEYNRRRNDGEFVAEVSRTYQRWFECNALGFAPMGCKWEPCAIPIFPCVRADGGHYTMTGRFAIGPGTDTKYLKAWRSGNTQTTLLNTDGIRTRTYAREYPTNTADIQQASGWAKYLDPVHCGRGSTVSETRYQYVTVVTGQYCAEQSCGWSGCSCVRYANTYGTERRNVTISGTWVQEWRSDLGWSRRSERYTSSPNVGTWTNYNSIPASF